MRRLRPRVLGAALKLSVRTRPIPRLLARLITIAVGVYRFIRGQPVEDCRSKEKPATPVGLVPFGNGGHVTFVLPVRNRAKHVWSHWADILRNSRAAHGAHFRSGGALLAPEPLSPAMRTLRSIRGVSVEPRQANKDGFSGPVRQQNCSAAVLDDHIPY